MTSLDYVSGRRLLFAGSRLGWIWLVALLIAVVLLVVLYREERRLVSRRAGLFLIGLRLSAAAALVLALFEPIAARSLVETHRGRVIVAVDISESMSTVDRGRSAENGAKLAQVLGLAPGESVASLSRREVVRRLIDGPGSPVARVAAEHAVDAVTFARETTAASLMALADIAQESAQAGRPGALAHGLGAGACARARIKHRRRALYRRRAADGRTEQRRCEPGYPPSIDWLLVVCRSTRC